MKLILNNTIKTMYMLSKNDTQFEIGNIFITPIYAVNQIDIWIYVA